MIDWNKPIELDTVPPRPARVVYVTSDGVADVLADWCNDGGPDCKQYVRQSGEKIWQPENFPRVRNAPDSAAIIAELVSAATAFIAELDSTGDFDNWERCKTRLRAAVTAMESRP